MNQFRFGSKAGTLRDLRGQLSLGVICPQYTVEHGEWLRDADQIVSEAIAELGHVKFAVRSSAQDEDGEAASLAGAYVSVLDVEANAASLRKAVDDVFSSYTHPLSEHEVLLQPMVRNVRIAGVVLTRDLDTGSPYFVINYDSSSGRTDAVTSGQDSKTVMVHRSRADKLKSERLRRLIECVIEIENVTGSHELDIEFCINQNDEVYILQVRPLAARSKWSIIPDDRFDSAIDEIRTQIRDLSLPDTSLYGERTIFSEMTDWNPAEMIGSAPKPLALSLYKSLITDSIWARARAQMGYQMVDGPLLYALHGKPFIDVRKSLNSFLPNGIDASAAEKLIAHQLDQLADNRELHDKVEFAIAVTCQDFETNKVSDRLSDAGIEKSARNAIVDQIRSLTKRLIEAGADGLQGSLAEANTLRESPAAFDHHDRLMCVNQLLERCRLHGTLPFSQLARHGFIAVQLLRSLVTQNVLTPSDADNFMHGVRTVASDLIHDMNAVHSGSMARDKFLELYGHLRPGTYDIMSWRYEERPDVYLGQGTVRAFAGQIPFDPSQKQVVETEKLISEAGFEISVTSLFDYIAAAIKGREQSKFAFTRAISDALKLLTEWGDDHNFSREDVSFLEIEMLLRNPDPGYLRDKVAAARETYAVTRAIRLPHIILDSSDIDIVRLPLGQPTYVTGNSVVATGHELTQMDGADIDDKIVLIESADPGFDWIFSHRVLGLITKYGGANSHMAIRCAEFGLPAAIGCGERLYETLCKAQTIELNASARKLTCH